MNFGMKVPNRVITGPMQLIFQPYILPCIIIVISFCICIKTEFIVKKN